MGQTDVQIPNLEEVDYLIGLIPKRSKQIVLEGKTLKAPELFYLLGESNTLVKLSKWLRSMYPKE